MNDFVIKASSLALRDVPEVNSAWQGTFIRQFNSADICVAVATENGLITPIVAQAETKGLASISNKVKELAEKARVGKLSPSEYQVNNEIFLTTKFRGDHSRFPTWECLEFSISRQSLTHLMLPF